MKLDVAFHMCHFLFLFQGGNYLCLASKPLKLSLSIYVHRRNHHGDWVGGTGPSQYLRIGVNSLVPPTFWTHWDAGKHLA